MYEDASYLQVTGSKAVKFNQNIGNANWTVYNAGGAQFGGSVDIISGGDLTVAGSGSYAGNTVLFADSSGGNVGIMRAPDPQFALDVNGPARATYWIGPHAIQLKDAICISHFDGPNPIYSNYQGQADGHMGQPATLTGGAIFRPGKFGKALQTGYYTVNLLSNPSFEGTYSSGVAPSWTAYATGTAAGTRASTTDAYVGSAAQRLTRTGGGASDKWGVSTTSAAIGGTSAAMQVRYKVLSYSAGAVIRMYADFTGGPFGEGASHTIVSADVGEWQVLWDTATVGSTDTCTFYVWIEGANASIVIDAAQVEGSNLPTPYCDGSLAGYDNNGVWLAAGVAGSGHGWTGTAHASTSSRAATEARLSTVELPLTGTVMCWVMSSAPLYSAGGAEYFYLLDHNNTAGIIVYVRSSGSLGVWCGGANTINYALNSTNFAPFTWHHIALTWDYGALVTKLYLDGALVGTGGYQTPASDGAGWDIGCYGSLAQWLGWIDDFALTSQAMTATAIRSIYESNAPVFAETSQAGFRATPKQLVWADDEGLWMRDSAGNPVLGVYGGEAATKSWAGFTLAAGDIVFGRNAIGSSAIWWDQSAGKFGFYGAGSGTPQVEIATDGKLVAGAGAVKLDSAGFHAFNASAVATIDIDSNGIYLGDGGGRTTVATWTSGNRIRAYNVGEMYEATPETYLDDSSISRTLYPLVVRAIRQGNDAALVEISAVNTSNVGAFLRVGEGFRLKDYYSTYGNRIVHAKADSIVLEASDLYLAGLTTNTTQSTGTGTLKMAGTTSRNNTGFLRVTIGGTVAYIPYFTTITG
jgi:hypothetical protein